MQMDNQTYIGQDFVEDALQHYGTLGMKWGVRRYGSNAKYTSGPSRSARATLNRQVRKARDKYGVESYQYEQSKSSAANAMKRMGKLHDQTAAQVTGKNRPTSLKVKNAILSGLLTNTREYRNSRNLGATRLKSLKRAGILSNRLRAKTTARRLYNNEVKRYETGRGTDASKEWESIKKAYSGSRKRYRK